MSCNVFKSNTKQNNSNNFTNHRKESNFFINEKSRENERKNKENKQGLIVNDSNFPELGKNDNPKNTIKNDTDNEKINFASMVKKEKEIEEIKTEEKLLPGWIKISRNSDNKIVMEYGEPKIEKEESINDAMNNIINIMKLRWEKHKDEFIELYGEEAYEKKYIGKFNYNIEEEYYDYEDDSDY